MPKPDPVPTILSVDGIDAKDVPKGFEEGEEWALMARGQPVGPEAVAELYNLAEPQKGSQWGIGSGNA